MFQRRRRGGRFLVVGLVLIAVPVPHAGPTRTPCPQGKVAEPGDRAGALLHRPGRLSVGGISRATWLPARSAPTWALPTRFAAPRRAGGRHLQRYRGRHRRRLDPLHRGVRGAASPITPNILRYQDQGMSFANAYAHVPASNYFLVDAAGGDGARADARQHDLMPMTRWSWTRSRRRWPSAATGPAFFSTRATTGSRTPRRSCGRPGSSTCATTANWECAQGVYATEGFADSYLNTSNEPLHDQTR